jgi:unspecific monooxygenase
MFNISLEVILQIVFGLSSGKRYQHLKALITDLLDLIDSPVLFSIFCVRFLQQDWCNWSPWGRMIEKRTQICNLLQAEIDDRKNQASANSDDILSLMMAARDENEQAMSDEELKDELLTILSRCQLTLLENKPVKIQRRGFALAPQGGVRMLLNNLY